MPVTRPPYPEEFRRRAVALVLDSGRRVEDVAEELGVSAQSLRNWVRQTRVDAGQGHPSELTTVEKAELGQLRRDIRVLREEREILKKAAAFFAKESAHR